MAEAIPENEIEDFLVQNWNGKTLIAFENEATFVYPPQDENGVNQPFIDIEFPGSASIVWGIGDPGNNSWRDDGAFQVLVCVPTGSGARLARQYAREVASIFRGQTIGNGIVCYAPHPPRAGGSEDGTYYVVAVSVPFAFQYIG